MTNVLKSQETCSEILVMGDVPRNLFPATREKAFSKNYNKINTTTVTGKVGRVFFPVNVGNSRLCKKDAGEISFSCILLGPSFVLHFTYENPIHHTTIDSFLRLPATKQGQVPVLLPRSSFLLLSKDSLHTETVSFYYQKRKALSSAQLTMQTFFIHMYP